VSELVGAIARTQPAPLQSARSARARAYQARSGPGSPKITQPSGLGWSLLWRLERTGEETFASHPRLEFPTETRGGRPLPRAASRGGPPSCSELRGGHGPSLAGHGTPSEGGRQAAVVLPWRTSTPGVPESGTGTGTGTGTIRETREGQRDKGKTHRSPVIAPRSRNSRWAMRTRKGTAERSPVFPASFPESCPCPCPCPCPILSGTSKARHRMASPLTSFDPRVSRARRCRTRRSRYARGSFLSSRIPAPFGMIDRVGSPPRAVRRESDLGPRVTNVQRFFIIFPDPSRVPFGKVRAVRETELCPTPRSWWGTRCRAPIREESIERPGVVV
jgi:hypothetical protein